MNNIEKLISEYKNFECLLIESEVNRKYMTGFSSSAGYLVIGKNGSAFFTDSRYIEAAEKEITACPVYLLKEFKNDIVGFISEHGYTKIHIEAEKISVSHFNYLTKVLKPKKICADV